MTKTHQTLPAFVAKRSVKVNEVQERISIRLPRATDISALRAEPRFELKNVPLREIRYSQLFGSWMEDIFSKNMLIELWVFGKPTPLLAKVRGWTLPKGAVSRGTLRLEWLDANVVVDISAMTEGMTGYYDVQGLQVGTYRVRILPNRRFRLAAGDVLHSTTPQGDVLTFYLLTAPDKDGVVRVRQDLKGLVARKTVADLMKSR